MTGNGTSGAGDAAEWDETSEEGAVTFYRPTIVALLYLLNVALGITVVIGLILAYIWRRDEDAQDWERSHFTYLIRTFWIGFWVALVLTACMVAAALSTAFANGIGPEATPADAPFGVLAAIFGMACLGFLLVIWYCVRCILSLVAAASRRPMPKPRTWLF
jgi:uncharacterized membrane protein|tara:strand:- start:2248 stop:2730 length:483 start_codon:yes stop_codon:yes gene_type:complete